MKIKIIFFNYNFLFYSFVGFSQFFDNLKIVTKRGKYNFHISDELLWKITQIPQYRFEVILRNFVRLDNIFQLICQWYKNFSYFWVFFRIFSQSYRVLRLFWHTSKFLLNPLNIQFLIILIWCILYFSFQKNTFSLSFFYFNYFCFMVLK